MEIRRAEPDDAPALRTLAHAAYGHYVSRIGREPAPMNEDYGCRIAAGDAWVLDDGGVVGYVVLHDQPERLLLENVAVRPSAQGKGYGRRLIAFAEAEARRRGCDALVLYTHALMTENLALYQRLGFIETRRVCEDGFDRVYMTKPLA